MGSPSCCRCPRSPIAKGYKGGQVWPVHMVMHRNMWNFGNMFGWCFRVPFVSIPHQCSINHWLLGSDPKKKLALTGRFFVTAWWMKETGKPLFSCHGHHLFRIHDDFCGVFMMVNSNRMISNCISFFMVFVHDLYGRMSIRSFTIEKMMKSMVSRRNFAHKQMKL